MLFARIEVRLSATHTAVILANSTSHVYAFNLQSRDASPRFAKSRTSTLWRLFAFHKVHSARRRIRRHCRKIAGDAVCKWRMYFSRTSYVFYRFRRRFSTRILRSYHQSNRATREGRHFHVSGETSRRLQGKLHEKRRYACDVVTLT